MSLQVGGDQFRGDATGEHMQIAVHADRADDASSPSETVNRVMTCSISVPFDRLCTEAQECRRDQVRATTRWIELREIGGKWVRPTITSFTAN